MKLSDYIIKIRTDNNLTQEEFAERLFVTRQAVSKWERGISTPDIEILKKICVMYKISLNVLLGTLDNSKSDTKQTLAVKSKKNKIYWFIGALIGLLLVIFYFSMMQEERLGYKIYFAISLIIFLICVIQIFLYFRIPKIMIEQNDYGIFLNYPNKVFIKYEDIIDVSIYQTRYKSMLFSFGSIKIITKDKKYSVNGVEDVEKIQKEILYLKTKNTFNEI